MNKCRLILTIIGTLNALPLSVLAQEADMSPAEPSTTPPAAAAPSSSPAADGIETEVREFKRGQIRDIQFHASIGRIIFKVDDAEFDWRPAIEEKAPASVADEITASAAVLEEFRRAQRIMVRVSAKPDKPKHYLVRRMVFLFDALR